jgi:hypothetical protein
MAVPETAVHEQDGTPLGQYDVGTTRKARNVDTEAIPEPMKYGADNKFRLRVL